MLHFSYNTKGFGGILLLLISGLCISSCNSEFLDRKPLDRISESDVWKDATLIEGYVNTCYNIRHGFLVDFYMMPLSDEAFRRGRETYHLINRGELSPVNNTALHHWDSYYNVITDCNIFFSKIDEAPIDDKLKNQYKGEVGFIRAWAYFRLVSFYGGVPLITEPFDLNDDFGVKRNTFEECIVFITGELEKAIDLLPQSFAGANRGRATKGAAMALKSRVLLYDASPLNNAGGDRAKWEKAASAAKDLIDMGQYDLHSDYKSLFTNSNNPEIIWAREFQNNLRVEASIELHFYPNGSGGYGQVNPLHNLVDDYETTNGLLPAEDPSYDPQNPYVNRDPRFYASIIYDGAPWQGREIGAYLPGGPDSSEGTEGWNASFTSYSVRKFINESIGRPSGTNVGNSPWIFFRFGEILLNYAESMYHLGNEEVAREFLNKIRSRTSVEMPSVNLSGPLLLEKIQHERRIELVFEEHRYFDVRRWKIADKTDNKDAMKMSIQRNPVTGEKKYSVEVFQERAFRERNYLVPIPQSEIERNSLLEQNSGY